MRLFIVAAFVAALMALGASAAFAGEITGNGKLKDVKGNRCARTRGQEDLQWYTDDGDGTARTDPTKGDPKHLVQHPGWSFRVSRALVACGLPSFRRHPTG